jgi:fused signal recognition particle receptor
VISRRRAVFRMDEDDDFSPDAVEAAATAPEVAGGGLGARVRALFGSGVSETTWDGLEDLLIKADVGPRGSADLVRRVRDGYEPGTDPADVLRSEVLQVLGPDEELHLAEGKLVPVILGRRQRLRQDDDASASSRSAPRDRARGEPGCERPFPRGRVGAARDPGRSGRARTSSRNSAAPTPARWRSDAVASATARGSDVLIVDTAGRLHTKAPLMDELAKVKRVIEKAGGEVDETFLVLDATTGQNGISCRRGRSRTPSS